MVVSLHGFVARQGNATVLTMTAYTYVIYVLVYVSHLHVTFIELWQLPLKIK